MDTGFWMGVVGVGVLLIVALVVICSRGNESSKSNNHRSEFTPTEPQNSKDKPTYTWNSTEYIGPLVEPDPVKYREYLRTYEPVTDHSIKKMLEWREKVIRKYLEPVTNASVERIELNDHETVLKINENFLVYFGIRTEDADFEKQRAIIESGRLRDVGEHDDHYHLHIEELTYNDQFGFEIQNLRDSFRDAGFYIRFAELGAPQDFLNAKGFSLVVNRLADEHPELKLRERSGEWWETVYYNSVAELNIHKDIESFIGVEKSDKCLYLSGRDNDVLYLDLDVAANYNPDLVKPLGYYPSYSTMSIHQRTQYLRFLGDPFGAMYDIGYIFVFYYGLERHLCSGDITGAFNIIMRFKSMYDNKSFQTYSNTALALTCLKKRKYDLIEQLIDFIRGREKPYLPIDIYLMLLIGVNKPFTAIDLFTYRADFGYKKYKYTKNNPEEFILTLEEGMEIAIGVPRLSPDDLRSFVEGVERQTKRVYANPKLDDVKAEIPQIHRHEIFYEACARALNETHELMKLREKKPNIS